MDDGQIFCQSGHARKILGRLDLEMQHVGASRDEGEDVKSIAYLLGAETAMTKVEEDWKIAQLSATCKIPPRNSAAHILGVDLDAGIDPTSQFRFHATKVRDIHHVIASVRDAAPELGLFWKGVDICKIVHLMRTEGTFFDGRCPK